MSLLAAACSGAPEEQEELESAESAISKGAPTNYTEAVTVSFMFGGALRACSGVLLAPRVVLTAGHCVDRASNWIVRSPIGAQESAVIRAEKFPDYETPADMSVTPDAHDAALLFLATPMNAMAFPQIARTATQSGTWLTNVGRTLNGTVTNELHEASAAVTSGARYGFPYSYVGTRVIEAGDSGGPSFVRGTHVLSGLNTGGNTTHQILLRVDTIANWITRTVGTFDQVTLAPLVAGHGAFGARGALASAFYSDATGFSPPQYTSTFGSADINGDGRADLYARGIGGIYVQLSAPNGALGAARLASTFFSDAAGWGIPQHYETIQMADVDGDGYADLLARGIGGIYMQRGAGNGTFGAAALVSDFFRDATGWNQPSQYKSIRAVDVNGDGRADLVGRGSAGVYVQLAAGAGRFGAARLVSDAFSDARGWAPIQHSSTLRLGDLDGDGLADLVGRASNGVVAQLQNADGTFGVARLLTTAFSDAAGWSAPQYYSSFTVADLNGDGYADLAARGGPGMYALFGRGNGTYSPLTLVARDLSDAAGYGGAPYASTIHAGDFDGDGIDDFIARSSTGAVWVAMLTPVMPDFEFLPIGKEAVRIGMR